MATERRFRGFMLAHVELVEARDDGSVAVIGLSGSGDAVAMVVHPETIDELVSNLCAVRRIAASKGIPNASGAFAGPPTGALPTLDEPFPESSCRRQRV
ncbi:hypothetical protein [uncultured Aureimonas sp.]|uniref:hypothetical protein n=1 Tax=uncultured Aureimonas sp. TaxID=1604662 RepID=UPI0025F1BA2D|nr:hypothetical protein [uncultured Aureimonas sp.]